MSEPRQNINIELASGNKDRLEDVRKWNGMTQKELVSRVLSWFCGQDRVLQQVILGQIPPEVAPDVALVVLKQLAQKREQDGGAQPAADDPSVTPESIAEIH